jgi:hypothetical protein
MPAFCAVITAAEVVAPKHAMAINFSISFNQNPFDALSTLHPDGTITTAWRTLDGVERPAGEYEVEGIILNLEDDAFGQVPQSIEITEALHDPLSLGTYLFSQGNGFDVRNGEIARAYWIGVLDSPDVMRRLVLTPSFSVFTPLWAKLESGPPDSLISYDKDGYPFYNCACSIDIGRPIGSPPVFSPSAGPATPAPGPLPILGVAAGFHASRNLRRRMQQGVRSI